ncbi:hypothetical protein ABE504_17060 [Paenibacillus oryzisoli]|uniref:hypothetical protein n=1 Tax=Paenibacillus oryzisoli TaxID=1850517 RepID=UPI003D2DFEB5
MQLWEKERKWVWLSLILTLLLIGYGAWTIFHDPSVSWQDRHFKSVLKNYGSQARILLFVVIGYYIGKTILQRGYAKRWSGMNKGVGIVTRWLRKLHTPIAVLAIGVIFLHITAAILYGMKWDFSNITGLLAAVSLLPVPIAGILRYRKLDRRWHMRSGLVFTALFLIHAFL